MRDQRYVSKRHRGAPQAESELRLLALHGSVQPQWNGADKVSAGWSYATPAVLVALIGTGLAREPLADAAAPTPSASAAAPPSAAVRPPPVWPSPGAAPAQTAATRAGSSSAPVYSSDAPAPPSTGLEAAGSPGSREKLVIIAGGDVSFGREAGRAVLDDGDYRPFRRIEPLWRDADLRFANLESQLSELGGETQSPHDRLVFAGPPGAAAVLARAGVGVVSNANNHAWDYGKQALLETLLYLDRAGIQHAGSGASLEEAERPALIEVKGWKIAVFAVTEIWNQGQFQRHPGRNHVAWARRKLLAERVAKARDSNDLVFVSYHGGAEYVNAPGGGTLDFTRWVMQAGADALFGHHPHVVQGVGWFGQRPAFYSLGNLLFGSRRGYPWTRYGMLARLEFEPSGERRVLLCPFRIEIGSHEPAVLDGKYADYDRTRFLSHLARVNAEVAQTTLGEPDAYGCVAVAPAAARTPQGAPPLPLAPSDVAVSAGVR